MLAVCTVGMPGSGKGVLVEVAREMGIKCFIMGDVVREEVARRGLKPTVETMNRVATELRVREGPEAVARRIYEDKIEPSTSDDEVIVIDGVRSIHELNYFKSKLGRVKIVAVHSSPKTRYERLKSRGRPGDPKSWDEFTSRDLQELEWGLGWVIALADYMLVNEGMDREEFKEEARRVLSKVISGDPDNC